MSVLYLTESEVAQLLDMPSAVEAVEEAFGKLAGKEAENSPRVRVKAAGVVYHSMTAAAGYLGYVGGKTYTTTPSGVRFLVTLWSAENGALVALLEANRLGQIRTGACTAVAVKYLTDLNLRRCGLFGSGWQAESQLAAVAAVRPVNHATIYSRDAGRRSRFAKEMSARLGIDVVAADEPQLAVQDLPLVITATTSRTPVFDGSWIAPGALVCAIGSNWLNKAEIDVTTVQRCRAVVCDDVESCRREAGDFVAATQQGQFEWGSAVELSDVVTGSVMPRSAREDIVLFKSVGMAIEDLAVASLVVQRARDQGVGVELPIG